MLFNQRAALYLNVMYKYLNIFYKRTGQFHTRLSKLIQTIYEKTIYPVNENTGF